MKAIKEIKRLTNEEVILSMHSVENMIFLKEGIIEDVHMQSVREGLVLNEDFMSEYNKWEHQEMLEINVLNIYKELLNAELIARGVNYDFK